MTKKIFQDNVTKRGEKGRSQGPGVTSPRHGLWGTTLYKDKRKKNHGHPLLKPRA